MVARQKPSDRLPLGSRRSSRNTACGGGASETGARCALGRCHTTGQGTPAGDQYDTDCIRRNHRTGGPRPRCQPRASRRQSHRLQQYGGDVRGEVARVAQGDRSTCDARCDRVQPADTPINAGLLHNVEVAAQRFAIQPIATPVQQISEIETAAAMLAREPGGGMILLPDTFTTTNRKPIIEAVARHRCLQSSHSSSSPPRVASFPMVSITQNCTDGQQSTLTAFSKAKSLPICRCSSRPNSNW